MKVICTCLVVMMIASLAFAQKQKPWTEWTRKDVDKTLNDSAWGQTQTEGDEQTSSGSSSAITQVAAPRAADRDINSKGETGESKPTKMVKYHVRFLSAKPVRAAFARLVLLTKAQSDDALTGQLQAFIDRDFADYIVVSVAIEVGDQRMAGPVTHAFATATTELLQKNVYLERKDGQKLFLSDYRAPIQDGMGAKFVFPRVLDGKPFLSETDTVRFVAQMNEKMKLNTKYKLSDMLYEGRLEY
jgi:hypothetical protein